MKLTMRWYGAEDRISLDYMKQIPNLSGVVTAIYDVAVGEVWPKEEIKELLSLPKAKGLSAEVIESIPVHEDIKLGLPTKDKYIEVFIENMRRVAAEGVKVVIYNFMPVFDWTRTQLNKIAPDGSNSLVYYENQIKDIHPLSGSFTLPGWGGKFNAEKIKKLFELYKDVDCEKLFDNLEYFLKAVVPVAEQIGVKLALHPDDPPWPIFGLPRIVTCEKNIDRILGFVNSTANGLTICTGSLGETSNNNVVKILDKYLSMDRVHVMHIRNVKLVDGGFEECAHNQTSGSLDMLGIMETLYKHNYQGYARPDHGRMIWGESGNPGYGLYDRALGISYIDGIWQTLNRFGKR